MSAAREPMQPNAYDYAVIGSGSAGGVVAARLSENGKYKVLCLEAGEKGAKYIWSRPPAGVVFMIYNPTVNWRYYAEPHESYGNRKLYVPRGKLLGGSSALNAISPSRAIDLVAPTSLPAVFFMCRLFSSTHRHTHATLLT